MTEPKAAADDLFHWRFHWIVYKGGLFIDNEKGLYTFSYWCWGQKVHRLHTFKKDVFNTNCYGYIKAMAGIKPNNVEGQFIQDPWPRI